MAVYVNLIVKDNVNDIHYGKSKKYIDISYILYIMVFCLEFFYGVIQ